MADRLHQEIEARNKQFMELFAKNDMTALSELYTEDCKLMPPGADTCYGRDGVRQIFEGMYSQGSVQLKLEIDEVGVIQSDSVAFERSRFTFYGKDGSVNVVGKYVVIWKKVNGVWHYYIDIFNPND